MSGAERTLDEQIVKNYTRARRFPQLIGVTHDGQRIPGGPYTYTQFIGGGLMMAALSQTTALWATGSMLRDAVVFIAVVGLTIWGLGRLSLKGRNPLSVAAGVLRALLAGGGHRIAIDGERPRDVKVGVLEGAVEIGGDRMRLPTAEALDEISNVVEVEDDSKEEADSGSRVEDVCVDQFDVHPSADRVAVVPVPRPVDVVVPDKLRRPAEGRVVTGNADRLLAMAAAARRKAS